MEKATVVSFQFGTMHADLALNVVLSWVGGCWCFQGRWEGKEKNLCFFVCRGFLFPSSTLFKVRRNLWSSLVTVLSQTNNKLQPKSGQLGNLLSWRDSVSFSLMEAIRLLYLPCLQFLEHGQLSSLNHQLPSTLRSHFPWGFLVVLRDYSIYCVWGPCSARDWI